MEQTAIDARNVQRAGRIPRGVITFLETSAQLRLLILVIPVARRRRRRRAAGAATRL